MYKPGDKVRFVKGKLMPDEWVGIVGVVQSIEGGWAYVRFKDPDITEEWTEYFKLNELKPLNSQIIKTRLGVK